MVHVKGRKEKEKKKRVVERKFEGKRPLGRPRS